MRFTASANWTSISSGSNRVITWTVSVKKTTALNEALSSGTWVDVTSFLTDFPPISQRIEYEVGQFSSDSISFTARNIDWWEANIFNASASQYLELKITATQSRGSTTTSDTFYAFSGFIDKAGVVYDEIADSVSFDVYTADELGNRLDALNINTQYINDTFNGSTSGLALPNIPGVYVVSANVTSYVAKVGLHTLFYNGTTLELTFDGGTGGSLSGGSLTLTSEDGLEKLELYVVASECVTSTVDKTDWIIVTTAGTTLPQQPINELSMKRYLEALYSKVGIDTVTLDTLTLNTNDGTRKVSYYDIPPSDGSVTGKKTAMCTNGTDAFMCVGLSLYKRTTSTQAYTLLESFTTGAGVTTVKRLFHNGRNNDIWIFYTNATNGDCVRRYNIDADSMAAEVVLHATPATVNPYNVSIVDDNYTGSSYLYGLMAGIAGTKTIKFVDGVTNGLSTPITMAYDIEAGTHDFHYQKATDAFYFKCKDAGTNYYNEITIDGAGAWVDGSSLVTTGYNSIFAAVYHASEDRIYYFVNSGGTNYIKSHTHNNNTATTVVTLPSGVTFDVTTMMTYQNSKVYAVTGEASFVPSTGTFYEITANTIDYEYDGIFTEYGGLAYISDRVYGIDIFGRFFQLYTAINMYLNNRTPQGTIKSTITDALRSFNLVGTISAHKKAFVYRRGNDSGTIQTTGNNLSLTTSNTSGIQKILNEFQLIAWVEVTSGSTTFSYDGTTYNAGILTDAKTLTISNDLIPEAIVKDVAKYFFAFFNTAHDKYVFDVDVSKMEYEVMDGASVTFSTTKIAQTATGLITAQTINNDGSMQIEVIF